MKPGGRLFLIDFDCDGSKLAAIAIRSLILLTRGREMACDFWRLYKGGLPGKEVKQMVIDAGFNDAECRVEGANYFISGRKTNHR